MLACSVRSGGMCWLVVLCQWWGLELIAGYCGLNWFELSGMGLVDRGGGSDNVANIGVFVAIIYSLLFALYDKRYYLCCVISYSLIQLYIMCWTKQAGTKHNDSCSMAFGKPSKHDDCPRCNELKEGAAPRQGWSNTNNKQSISKQLSHYCFSVPIYHSRCTKETNPSCACGKMSYTD